MSDGPKVYDLSRAVELPAAAARKRPSKRSRFDFLHRGAGRWILRLQLVGLILLGMLYLSTTGKEILFPSRGGEEAAVRQTMLLIVDGLEYHRVEHGELPRTLGEIQLDEAGIRYQTDGQTFTLMGHADGIQIHYRDGDDISELHGEEVPTLAAAP